MAKVVFCFYFFVLHLLSCTFAEHKQRNLMTLHVFNPEHDIALAYDNKYFTAPHAGRQLRHDLDYLPALWAEDGDLVLVENVASARNHARRFMRYSGRIRFVDRSGVGKLSDQIDRVSPWGWDAAVKFQLEQAGIREAVLPGGTWLAEIRRLSNRRFSSTVLKELRACLPGLPLVGEAFYAGDVEEVKRLVEKTGRTVIKAPWSSSGRGIRYVDSVLDAPVESWARKVTVRQGGMMVEPYYGKVKDFGMEFVSDKTGVHYAGLSVFHTVNGAYVGNSLADETEKRELISAYIPGDVLDKVGGMLEQILTHRLQGIYQGCFGVDMMAVAYDGDSGSPDAGFRFHPVVEINLRRTMGHIALTLSERHEFHNRMMRIDYDGSHYHLHTVHND